MTIDRDNFTEMTILPFGVQDWATDRQYRQLHCLLDMVAYLLNRLPKSDRMNSIAQTMIDIFGLLFSSYVSEVNCCAISTKTRADKNSESYDPANTEIIVLDLTDPTCATLFLGVFTHKLQSNMLYRNFFINDRSRIYPTYKFDLNDISELRLAATVILAMCEHDSVNQWKPTVSKAEKK